MKVSYQVSAREINPLSVQEYLEIQGNAFYKHSATEEFMLRPFMKVKVICGAAVGLLWITGKF